MIWNSNATQAKRMVNLLLLNRFYPVMVVTSLKRERRIVVHGFGHSLRSAISCQRKVINGKRTKLVDFEIWILRNFVIVRFFQTVSAKECLRKLPIRPCIIHSTCLVLHSHAEETKVVVLLVFKIHEEEFERDDRNFPVFLFVRSVFFLWCLLVRPNFHRKSTKRGESNSSGRDEKTKRQGRGRRKAEGWGKLSSSFRLRWKASEDNGLNSCEQKVPIISGVFGESKTNA